MVRGVYLAMGHPLTRPVKVPIVKVVVIYIYILVAYKSSIYYIW